MSDRSVFYRSKYVLWVIDTRGGYWSETAAYTSSDDLVSGPLLFFATFGFDQ
jgi:hypothetical protein